MINTYKIDDDRIYQMIVYENHSFEPIKAGKILEESTSDDIPIVSNYISLFQLLIKMYERNIVNTTCIFLMCYTKNTEEE